MISFSHLGLTNSLDLYKCAKAFADIVIPQVSHSNKQNEPGHGGLIVLGGDSKIKRIQALVNIVVLHSWARHFPVTMSLYPGVRSTIHLQMGTSKQFQ